MNASRRLGLKFLLSASLAPLALSSAFAGNADESRKPIRLLVGYPPGGPADIVARIMAERLSTVMGRAVVVDNRPGAGGQIAAQALKAAPADGSTLFLSNTHTIVTVPLTVASPGFSPSTDFRPIGTVANFELALAVHKRTGVKNLSELKAWLGTHTEEANIGVPAPMSAPEFIAGKLARAFRTKTVPVPYRGAAPMVQDLLAGQVAAAVSGVSDFLPYLDSGSLRILAVTRETPILAGVPSFEQAGYKGLDATDVLAMYAPIGMTETVVSQFNTAIRQVLSMPDVAAKLRGYAMTAAPSTPAEHTQRLSEVSRTLTNLMKDGSYTTQ